MEETANQAPVNTVEVAPEDLGPDSVALGGLLSGIENEERAMALLSVVRNNQRYEWKAFVPPSSTDLGAFIAEITPRIYAEIDTKEAAWATLEPKTRTIEDPFMGEPRVVPIDKSEVVCPDVPDYYAKRRAEYPPLAEQLDAFWKGVDSPEYTAMLAKIQAIKSKYPKP